MEILGKLFGGVGKVRIMRLFLFNSGTPFEFKDITYRSAVSDNEARRTLRLLEAIGFIKRRPFFKEEVGDHPRDIKRTRVSGFELDESFSYLADLKALLVHSVLFKDSDVTKRLSRAGHLKFVAIAGAFINNPESRVDLLVVGDKLKERVVENVVRSLEAEIGKELRYSVLETDDFKYRLGVFDKLVRDILDYPHRTIIDRVGVKERLH